MKNEPTDPGMSRESLEKGRQALENLAAVEGPTVIRRTDNPQLARQLEVIEQLIGDMRWQLERNQWRGDWSDASVGWAFVRLCEQVGQLGHAILAGDPQLQVLHDAANVANYAAIVWDLYRTWQGRGPLR